MDLKEVNALSTQQFIQIFSNVVEKCTKFAEFLEKSRPFSGFDCIVQKLDEYFESLDESDILKVLSMHPDLMGRAAVNLTIDSKSEQKGSGLWNISEDYVKKLEHLNQLYRQKFNFPFIICVRENKLAEIWKSLEERLDKQRDEEVLEACYQVKLIAINRIKALITGSLATA